MSEDDLREVVRRIQKARKLRARLRKEQTFNSISQVFSEDGVSSCVGLCDSAVGWRGFLLDGGLEGSFAHAFMHAAFATHLILIGEDLCDYEKDKK